MIYYGREAHDSNQRLGRNSQLCLAMWSPSSILLKVCCTQATGSSTTTLTTWSWLHRSASSSSTRSTGSRPTQLHHSGRQSVMSLWPDGMPDWYCLHSSRLHLTQVVAAWRSTISLAEVMCGCVHRSDRQIGQPVIPNWQVSIMLQVWWPALTIHSQKTTARSPIWRPYPRHWKGYFCHAYGPTCSAQPTSASTRLHTGWVIPLRLHWLKLWMVSTSLPTKSRSLSSTD